MLAEQEEELRSVLGSPNSYESQEPSPSTFDAGGVLFGFHQGLTNTHFHPTQWQALQLWQTFLNNVDLVVKVLHVPTVQEDIYAGINNHNCADDLNALLFAIYFAATTSLSRSTAENLLGQEKGEALNSYKRGLEYSLSKCNFLNSPSMKSLQAMTIYIVSDFKL